MKQAFSTVVQALTSSGARFAITGGGASIAFGEPRYTNDVDFIADFTAETLARFVGRLPATYYRGEVDTSSVGLPFSVIYLPLALKFDFFGPADFPLGFTALQRAVLISDTGLADVPLPFMSAEDTVVSKRYSLKMRPTDRERDWRDLTGIVERRVKSLDVAYLRQQAALLNLDRLLEKALTECENCYSL